MSRNSSQRANPRQPLECTNLLWTDLANMDGAGAVMAGTIDHFIGPAFSSALNQVTPTQVCQ
jgi:hypothetical protein